MRIVSRHFLVAFAALLLPPFAALAADDARTQVMDLPAAQRANRYHSLPWLTPIVSIAACQSEPRLDVAVIAEHEPPAVQSSYSLDELRRLATRSGRSGRHAPLGFYIGTFGYTVEVTTDGAGTPGCDPALRIEVRMLLTNRLVEIGTDLQTQQCRPEAVLSHYLVHANQDDQLLSRYASRALAMLDRMPRTELLGAPAQGDAREAVAVVVRRVMDELLRPFDEDRRQAFAVADSVEELARLRGACVRAF